MQQFVVPQFIDVEDKIIGPITIRQFLIMLAGGLIIFITYRLADFELFIFTLVVVGGISFVLAFIKINGQSFHYVILNIVQFLKKPSVRVWDKTRNKKDLNYLRKKTIEKKVEEKKVVKRRGGEHVRDLALIVNTGGYYRGDLNRQQTMNNDQQTMNSD